MGNANCIADGGTPHRSDITICNQTDIDLSLDMNKTCQRECNHRGFAIKDGKIVLGCEPPLQLPANSISQFSVSGRDGTAVAPSGQVYYGNASVNLEICITWTCSGWTHNLLSVAPPDQNHLSGLVTGKAERQNDPPSDNKEPCAWHELISVIPNSNTMDITIKPKALMEEFKGMLEHGRCLKDL